MFHLNIYYYSKVVDVNEPKYSPSSVRSLYHANFQSNKSRVLKKEKKRFKKKKKEIYIQFSLFLKSKGKLVGQIKSFDCETIAKTSDIYTFKISIIRLK